MCFVKRIFFVFINLYMLLKIVFLSTFYKKRIYIFGTPIHGNIGDQAIIIAEREFMQDNFPQFKVIEVESKLVKNFKTILKKVVGTSTILVHGGGFLGTIWMDEEEMFRLTLKTFINNRIIVFPQTVYFSDDEFGNRVLKESKEIYSNHTNLFICCREKYSYDFMQKEMPECNVLLIPDMVIYLKNLKTEFNKENVLFCIRNDREKVQYDLDIIERSLKKEYNIDYTDTVIGKKIFPYNRKKFLINKLEQFAKYKLIVTDRLHGMVFALLAKTSCIVLENKSYKVKGVYDWIKSANYIKLINIKEIDEKMIDSLMNINEYSYDREINVEKYKPLIKLISME